MIVQEFNFDVFTQKKFFSNSINYKFKEVTYVTKKELDTILQWEVKILRIEENERRKEEARLATKKIEEDRLEVERLDAEKQKEEEKEKIKSALAAKYNLK